jgi:ribosomal protein S18 acetylase RimI-like enzyme
VTANAPLVARVAPGVHWHALDDDEVAGRGYALHRPDGRVFISVDTWRDDVFGLLVAAVVHDLRRDLYTIVDEADAGELERWSAEGFEPHRREGTYLVPTAPEATGLHGVAVPAGFTLISADAADIDRLRALDELLREDVPGSDGWVNDPEEFREYTFDSRMFDPATYLVAVHEPSGQYAGLVRVWKHPTQPRLGLVGVRRSCRRRGLARALLAAAFAPLHARGRSHVLGEVDATNAASTALLTGLDARRTGGSVELLRRHEPGGRHVPAG